MMTPREQALLGYFYQIATDPKVAAAGRAMSPTRFKDAVLSCVAEDVPAVALFVLKGAAGKAAGPARAVAGMAARTAVGGVVSDQVASHAAGMAEAVVGDVFEAAVSWISRKAEERKRR